jgi:hypothetical protein
MNLRKKILKALVRMKIQMKICQKRRRIPMNLRKMILRALVRMRIQTKTLLIKRIRILERKIPICWMRPRK